MAGFSITLFGCASMTKLQVIPTDLLSNYQDEFNNGLEEKFDLLADSTLSISTFSFYTSVSAVFSSRIEGEAIELDSFVKYKRFGVKYQPDYTRKIDDLYDAYLFAQNEDLNEENVSKAHATITRHILDKQGQGTIRLGNMYVLTQDGKIEYVAAPPDQVENEIKKLFADLRILLNNELSFPETFYFASMIHLVFVKIHPFEDGNGRTARLLEKWFLAQKLGPKAWFMQSEKHYYEHHKLYYHNIRKLGLEYEELDYSASLAFLKMLPNALLA